MTLTDNDLVEIERGCEPWGLYEDADIIRHLVQEVRAARSPAHAVETMWPTLMEAAKRIEALQQFIKTSMYYWNGDWFGCHGCGRGENRLDVSGEDVFAHSPDCPAIALLK